MHDMGNEKPLCQLEAGSTFFDDEAAEVRKRYKREANSLPALTQLRKEHRADEKELEKRLLRELSVHPRRRGKLSD